MSPDQLEEVISAIPELKIRKWYDYDVEYLFRNMYWLALRPIEAIMLKKEDFKLSSKQVFLGKTKTNDYDFASIPPPYLHKLEMYLARKEDGRLLDKLTYKTFYLWLGRLGKICDVDAWTIPQKDTHEKTMGHIFRKSIGKDMLYGVVRSKSGKKFEIPIISKQLRHAKPSTTIDSYLKASIEQVKEAWE